MRTIEGEGGGEAVVVAMVVAMEVAQLDVMQLSIAQLKAELRKRSQGTGGNKSAMQVRLKEVIDLNVPVFEESGGNEAHRPDFMVGLDVTAKWELLTQCDDPIPQPDNGDGNLQSPTKMYASVNPKYGFIETFDHIPSTGTTEKMWYCCPNGRSINWLRKEKRKRKQSESWHSRPILEV